MRRWLLTGTAFLTSLGLLNSTSCNRTSKTPVEHAQKAATPVGDTPISDKEWLDFLTYKNYQIEVPGKGDAILGHSNFASNRWLNRGLIIHNASHAPTAYTLSEREKSFMEFAQGLAKEEGIKGFDIFVTPTQELNAGAMYFGNRRILQVSERLVTEWEQKNWRAVETLLTHEIGHFKDKANVPNDLNRLHEEYEKAKKQADPVKLKALQLVLPLLQRSYKDGSTSYDIEKGELEADKALIARFCSTEAAAHAMQETLRDDTKNEEEFNTALDAQTPNGHLSFRGRINALRNGTVPASCASRPR